MILTNITELCDIQIGRTPKRSEVKYWGEGHNWLSIADMGEKYVSYSKEEVTNLAVDECKMKIVPKNTVVMSFKLTIGRLGITEKDLYTNEAIAAFLIKDKNLLLPEYLYYSLKGYNFDYLMDRAAKGKTLNKKKLAKIHIPLTPIDNQKKIIDLLNKAENLLVKRQQQIEALSALKQSIFLDMFGSVKTNKHKFKIAKLGDFTLLVTSGSTPRGGRKSYLNEGIPLIRSQNVLWNDLHVEDVVFISEETHNSMKRSQLNNRDVLLNITGASIGRSVVYEGENYNANVNQHVCIIRLNENINPYYLSYYFTSNEFQQNVVNKNIGATRQAFNYTQIKNFEILVPNIVLQNDFEDKVSKINKQIKLLSKSLNQINILYDSILHKAFNGELFHEDREV